MEDSSRGYLGQFRAQLFGFAPESQETNTVLENEKCQVWCKFKLCQSQSHQMEIEGQGKPKNLIKVGIWGQWLCEMEEGTGEVISKIGCNCRHVFQVLRRPDYVHLFLWKLETGDMIPYGLILRWGAPFGATTKLFIEECDAKQLQRFVRVLQRKFITQGGFANIFKPVRRLGRGITATVYSAMSLVDRKTYAIKCFSKGSDGIRSQQLKQAAFEKQFKIWQSLSHPNLAYLFTAFTSENSFYMVTSQLYTTLHSFITRYGYIKQPRVKLLLKELLEGICYLHEHGIMHRDIKLENIMITREGLNQGKLKPVLVDFGLAQYIDQPQYLFKICGTPGYTAPQILALNPEENFQEHKYDEKCDLFSLGIVAYTLLCKRFPFAESTVSQVIQKNQQCDFRFDQAFEEALGLDGINFLSRLLAKNPAARMTALEALKHPYLNMPEPAEKKGAKSAIATALEIPHPNLPFDSDKHLK